MLVSISRPDVPFEADFDMSCMTYHVTHRSRDLEMICFVISPEKSLRVNVKKQLCFCLATNATSGVFSSTSVIQPV